MLRFIAENAYVVAIMAIFMLYMYAMVGEDLIFFRKKHYAIDPKANEKLDKALAKFARGRDAKVMGRTTIAFGESVYTFDALLLTYYGVIGFTAAPQGGDIYGELNDDEWVYILNNVRTPFYSPVKALNGSVKMFKDLFRAEKVKGGQAEVMVIFTNNDANVAVARTLPAYHLNKLQEVLTTSKLVADNGTDLEAMEAAIRKYSK